MMANEPFMSGELSALMAATGNAERARCLAIVRRVMATTTGQSDPIYTAMIIAERIESGEPA